MQKVGTKAVLYGKALRYWSRSLNSTKRARAEPTVNKPVGRADGKANNNKKAHHRQCVGVPAPTTIRTKKPTVREDQHCGSVEFRPEQGGSVERSRLIQGVGSRDRVVTSRGIESQGKEQQLSIALIE